LDPSCAFNAVRRFHQIFGHFKPLEVRPPKLNLGPLNYSSRSIVYFSSGARRFYTNLAGLEIQLPVFSLNGNGMFIAESSGFSA
ncbi:MAG: hypothetical protein ACREYC_22050, partial [Gammaproteobacteria bacterium]